MGFDVAVYFDLEGLLVGDTEGLPGTATSVRQGSSGRPEPLHSESEPQMWSVSRRPSHRKGRLRLSRPGPLRPPLPKSVPEEDPRALETGGE